MTGQLHSVLITVFPSYFLWAINGYASLYCSREKPQTKSFDVLRDYFLARKKILYLKTVPICFLYFLLFVLNPSAYMPPPPSWSYLQVLNC